MRISFRFLSTTTSVVLVAGLAACATQPYPGSPTVASYPANAYPSTGGYQTAYPNTQASPNNIEYGRVSNLEVLRSQEQPRSSGAGAILGGIAGAVVGNQFGGGSGRGVATVIGAVGGAAAGNAVESNRSGANVRETYRVSVQMDNGSGRAYDVPATGDLRIGDRVRVENGQIYRQ